MTKKERVPEYDLEQQLGLNPHLKVIFCGDDEILIKHGVHSLFSRSIRDDGRTKLIGKILNR